MSLAGRHRGSYGWPTSRKAADVSVWPGGRLLTGGYTVLHRTPPEEQAGTKAARKVNIKYFNVNSLKTLEQFNSLNEKNNLKFKINFIILLLKDVGKKMNQPNLDYYPLKYKLLFFFLHC